PGVGHAGGHHVSATAGAGAGVALAVALGTLPFPGRVQVIGTPAEEGGAGKVKLMEAGVFKDVDAAMMIHGRCGTQVWRPTLGIIKVKAEFYGKATHAASWPWRGVNALNAVIQLFVALDQMRQQLRPDARVLGLIGFSVDPDDGEAGYGSTDCGNVSQALPTIHPYIRIAPDGVPGHSREFAEWARSPMARAGLVAGAKALALTALDLLAAPEK